MGLDTTHDCWHGAYSAFSRFRMMLAETAGIPIGPDHSFCGGYTGDCESYCSPREYYLIDWDAYPDGAIYGHWGDETPEDPLIVLLNHSDCEGIIENRFCEPLAARLEELAPLMEQEGAGHFHSPVEQTLQFARGLREAAAAGENVEFH